MTITKLFNKLFKKAPAEPTRKELVDRWVKLAEEMTDLWEQVAEMRTKSEDTYRPWIDWETREIYVASSQVYKYVKKGTNK